LIDKELQDDKSLSNEEAAALVESKLIGIMMIESANDKKFDEYRRSLQNSMSEGHNRYPTGKAAAYTMLSKYQPNKKKYESVVNTSNVQRSRSSTRTRDTPASRISFYQRVEPVSGPPVAGNNGVTESSIDCWNCGRKGHRSTFCPGSVASDNTTDTPGASTGFQGMQIEYNFVQDCSLKEGEYHVKESWVLIDSGSTFNSACNAALLGNIDYCTPLKALSNRGNLEYNKSGHLKLLPDVTMYYNLKSLANILSLLTVTSKYKVTMDSSVTDAITVHLNDGKQLVFCRCGNGLYYFDTNPKSKENLHGYYSFLNTVTENKGYYTNQEMKRADDVRTMQSRVGWPSDTFLKDIILGNQIKNCNPTVDDIVI
jgi:hypothetical protein